MLGWGLILPMIANHTEKQKDHEMEGGSLHRACKYC